MNSLVRALGELSDRQARLLLAIFLSALSALALALLLFTPLDLSPDEAHYWEWSRRLGAAYYSKGPGIAYLIALSTAVFGASPYAVRLPALICTLTFLALLYLILRRQSSPGIALLLVLCAGTSLLFFSQTLLMTTDPPTALFWLCAIGAALTALKSENHWLWAAFFLGLTLLFKYTVAVSIPALAFFLVFSKSVRPSARVLTASGMIVLLFLLPILYWNATHEWANILHNAGHLTSRRETRFPLQYLFELIGGQIFLIGPALLMLCCSALYKGWREWRRGDHPSGLLVSFVVLLTGTCVVAALSRPVYANWPMPIYVAGLVLVARLLHRRRIEWEGAALWLIRGLGLNIILVALASALFLGMTFGIDNRRLPSKKLVGWRNLGHHAGMILQQMDPRSFIIAENYDVASELAFYVSSHPPVMVGSLPGRRLNQYDFWGGWEQLHGRDALIVVREASSLDLFAPHFDAIERIDAPHIIHYGGQELRRFHFAFGRAYQ